MFDITAAIGAFPKRKIDAHKGDLGHVLVIAGSYGYTGAAYLTSQAAMLSGSGLVTLAVGKGIYPILATKLTEVMVRPYIETKDGSLSLMAEKDILAFSEKCDCIALGPGISQNRETIALTQDLITKITKPLVIDADGLNALAGRAELLKKAKAPLVLTPHPGEFSRLTNKTKDEIHDDRKELALGFANEYNTVLVLKGHETVVASPGGEWYINKTGNPGMATAGCGDVLTGIITSFIGQLVDPFVASCLGVYYHGLAGDQAAAEKGMVSLLASDLLQKLPYVLKTLA